MCWSLANVAQAWTLTVAFPGPRYSWRQGSSNGYVDFSRLLVERGAYVNIRSDGGWSSILLTAGRGHLDIVRLLLMHGADPNVRRHGEDTPIHEALRREHLVVAQLLLEHGADVDSRKLEQQGRRPWRRDADN
ncbi:ankyrin repeat protein [Lactarius akahatsu]|uniref:Ankyrin repeat protein n=1 Tax=Lactarius akahatsu TaxID=416441 RepID=A0AAD4Q728_9AGAM|nr:ankyrin repeat protein [Lactarius akahatsu]